MSGSFRAVAARRGAGQVGRVASAVSATTLAALLLAGAAAAQAGPPGATAATDPGEFLQRLAGEWTVVTEARLAPGRDPVRREGRESARMVGGWLVAEGTGEVGGRSMTSILTVGFSAHEDRFVATYIDSMQAHLWQYTGTLDAAGTALTLETEGPVMGDPLHRARYRVVLEADGSGGRGMRSLILGPDGEWFEFGRTEYRRGDAPGGS